MNRLLGAYRLYALFTVAAALLLLAAPLAAKAQQVGKVARVGILSPITSTGDLGLRELGWVEGRNLAFERRDAVGQSDRLPALAADLLHANVDVIVAVGLPAIRAAKNASRTVPIVMAFCGIDPVKAGFVASLARPGGNVTGLAHLQTDLAVNSRNPSSAEQLAVLKSAAPALGVRVETVEVARSGEYADASMTIASTRPDGLIVAADPEFFRDRQKVVDLAAHTNAGLLRVASVRRSRWLCLVWSELGRPCQAGGCVRGQDSEGRQSGRLTSGAAHEVRARSQPEDRQSAGPDNPVIAGAAGRSAH
jgi:ABC-type uncharacterized transport system substrate-binding protein